MIPLLTVGLPTYNRGKVLASTITQILNQSFKDFELIIFNDGSTDNTFFEISNFIDDRIIFINSINLGPPHPLNNIINIAKGKYIIILHDHDFFDQDLLKDSINFLETHKEFGFVLQGSSWINEDGITGYKEMLLDLPLLNYGKSNAIRILQNKTNFDSFFHACCMIRKSTFEQAGYFFDEKFGLYSDVDLWFRLLAITNFGYLNKVYFKFRTREANHFLQNKDLNILQWLFEIQQNSINRIFNSEQELKKKLDKILTKKRNKHLVKYLFISLSKKNLEIINNIIQILKKENKSFLLQFFILCIKIKYIQSFFIFLIQIINTNRKKFK